MHSKLCSKQEPFFISLPVCPHSRLHALTCLFPLHQAHRDTEEQLTSQAQHLLSVADLTTTHVDHLHGKIARKSEVEQHNEAVLAKLKDDTNGAISSVKQDINRYGSYNNTHMHVPHAQMHTHTAHTHSTHNAHSHTTHRTHTELTPIGSPPPHTHTHTCCQNCLADTRRSKRHR